MFKGQELDFLFDAEELLQHSTLIILIGLLKFDEIVQKDPGYGLTPILTTDKCMATIFEDEIC
jgi:hypothetical protein